MVRCNRLCRVRHGVCPESNITHAINKTVARNVIAHAGLRAPIVVVEESSLLVEGLISLISSYQRVNGIVPNVRQKRRLLQFINQLNKISRDLSSSLGI
jgi:hypothetical protein